MVSNLFPSLAHRLRLIASVSHARVQSPATLIVGVFVVLATIYSVVTPLFETPDEVWHFRFITHVADTGTLPTQDPANPGPWRQEGSQPPLYYLLVAPLIAPLDTRDVDLITRYNPHAAVGRAGADGNVNFVVHTARERFPWRGAVLAAHLARFVSVLLGAATAALTYLLVLEVFGEKQSEPVRRLALGATLLVALNPQFLFISGAINNDNLVTTLATLTLVLLLRLVNHGPSTRRLVALGLVIGLAALSKLSGLGLWGLTALVLLVHSFLTRRSDKHYALRTTHYVLIFGIAIPVAGWWYVRNWMLYGDPTGLNVMLEIFGHRTAPVSPLQLIREFEGLRWSFWAVFGWFNVLPPGWVHRFFDLLSLAGVSGCVIFTIRRIQAKNWALLGRLSIPIIWLGITVIGLGRWTMMTSATQGRLLFPAISAIGLLFFTGLVTLTPVRYRSWLPVGLSVVLGSIALYVAFGVIRPAYAPPPALPPSQITALPNVLDGVVFGEQIALLGYDVTPEAVYPGDELRVTLYWRGLKPIKKDYSLFIHLVGENEAIISQRDSYPGRGNAPTSEWQPGVVFADTYRLRVPATASAPQSAWLAVGFYDLAQQHRLVLRGGGSRFPLRSVRLVPVGEDTGVPNPVDFNLGGQVRLVGYELTPRTVRPGETIGLVLYWQALADIERNYTVFTQLLSDDLIIWAQDDSQPLRGAYPTSHWKPGEVIRDPYHLTVRPDAPAGVYRLEVGMYLLDTGERLYRTDSPTANSIRVADVRVRTD